MPQGINSTQPVFLQTEQPLPSQIKQEQSSSKPGSTKGKYPGRKRTLTSFLKMAESNFFLSPD